MRLPQFPSSNSPMWQTLNNSTLLRFILLFIGGWFTFLFINFFYDTIAIFSVAGVLATLLNYPVVWLSCYLPRWLAITLTFLISIALILGLIVFVGLQVVNQGQALLSQLKDPLSQQPGSPLRELLNQMDVNNIIATLQNGLTSGLGLVKGAFSSLFVTLFGVVICLYMVIDGEKLWNMALKVIPVASRDRFARTFQLSFQGFIWGTIVLMLYYATSSLILFSLVGIQNALILAVILGLLDAIPGIGAVLGLVIVTVLVLFSQGMTPALIVFGITLVLEQIQENYVRPKVMKDELSINPVILFLSLFIGQRVAGLLGIFLAVPITGMIVAWMRSLEEENITALAASSDATSEPIDQHDLNQM
jgi:predicted PurR-regulated permease PerM